MIFDVGRVCAVVFEPVLVVDELLLECLDGFLLVDYYILALLPRLIDADECVMQHTVLVLQLLVLACQLLCCLPLTGTRLPQTLILLLEYLYLLLQFPVLVLLLFPLREAAVVRPARLLRLRKPHLSHALLRAVVNVATRQTRRAAVTLKNHLHITGRVAPSAHWTLQ